MIGCCCPLCFYFFFLNFCFPLILHSSSAKVLADLCTPSSLFLGCFFPVFPLANFLSSQFSQWGAGLTSSQKSSQYFAHIYIQFNDPSRSSQEILSAVQIALHALSLPAFLSVSLNTISSLLKMRAVWCMASAQ
jgi:hypothetical protein